MRTPEEIQRQIEGLKHEKEIYPEYSGFGDPNWAQADAMIAILEGGDLEDFEEGNWEELDETNQIYRAAEQAQDWLDGDDTEDLFSE